MAANGSMHLDLSYFSLDLSLILHETHRPAFRVSASHISASPWASLGLAQCCYRILPLGVWPSERHSSFTVPPLSKPKRYRASLFQGVILESTRQHNDCTVREQCQRSGHKKVRIQSNIYSASNCQCQRAGSRKKGFALDNNLIGLAQIAQRHNGHCVGMYRRPPAFQKIPLSDDKTQTNGYARARARLSPETGTDRTTKQESYLCAVGSCSMTLPSKRFDR